jgi:cobalt-zinc-cadmium efflux system outer membrane protein
MLVLLVALAFTQQAKDSLTLRGAIDLAQTRRSQVLLAGALTAEAQAGVRVAGTVPNPVASYQHTESSFTNEAKIEQRLDWLATRWSNRSAAQANLLGAQADSTQVVADLAREVRIAFYQSLAARETRRLVAEQGLIADSLVTLAEERVAVGDISVIEREQFAVEAGRARQALLQAQQDEDISRAALARAIGHPDTIRIELAGALDQGLGAALQETGPGIETIPALRRAVADSAAAASLTRVAGLQRLPIPSVVLGQEWDSEPFSSSSGWLLGLSFPIPIWNIGGGNAAVAEARAQSAAARSSERRLLVNELLAQTRARLEATQLRALFLRDSLLPRTQRLRAGVARLYRAGQINVLPLFDALRSERDVALSYTRTLFEFQQAVADWLALRGRTE